MKFFGYVQSPSSAKEQLSLLSQKAKQGDVVSYAFLDIKQNTKEGALSYTDKKDEVGCVFFKSPKTEFSGEQADWLKSNSYLLPDSFIKEIGGLDNLKHSLDSDPKKEFVDFLALAGNVSTSFSVQSLGPSSLDSWKCAISTDSGRKNFCRSISSITEKFQISCIGIDWEPISAITRHGLRDDFVEAMKSLSLQLKDKGIEFPVTVNHNVLNDFGKEYFYKLSQIKNFGIQVMGYDMQTQNITSLHSPLYDNYTASKAVAHFSSNKAVELLLSFGVPASKVTLLCPAYARVADDVKPGELIGSQCLNAGVKHYTEIPELVLKCELQESTLYGADVDGNKVASGACATTSDKKTFYSYDNPESMIAKFNYSKKLNLGFGIWKLEADAHVGCGSLLECVLVERANAHRTTEPGL